MGKTFIMQKDDSHSPAFTLQESPSRQDAREMIFRFELRRAIAKQEWPKWSIVTMPGN